MINIEAKIKNNLIIGFWIAYVIFTYIFYDKFTQIALNDGFVMGLLVFILTSPAYLALIYYVTKSSVSKFKAVIASILMALSFTIVSSPRDMLSNKILNLDTIVLSYFARIGLKPNLSIFVYYVIIPIIFGFLALELLGYTKVLKTLKNGNGGG